MSVVIIRTITVNIVAFIAATSLTWSSSTLEKLKDEDQTVFSQIITAEESSWISSCLALGAVIGPFLYGYGADKFGRKITILSLAVPFHISFLMLAFGTTPKIYYIARFLMGIPVGGTFTVLPMYIGEISSNENRGMLGSLFSVFITAGLLFSYAVGPYTTIRVFNIILAVFPILFIVGFYFICPESPYYLIKRNMINEAKLSLQKYRKSGVDVQDELKEIENFLRETKQGSFRDIFTSKALTKAFIMGIVLIILQQLSGINAVLFYAQNIFKNAGGSLSPSVASILVGIVQLLATSITPLVADKLGRKVLLMFSGIGMAISEIPLGVYFYLLSNSPNTAATVSWLPILCLLVYIVTYNVGFGAIVWTMMGEIFPSNVKSLSNASMASVCWIFGFIITKFFEPISACIGIGTCFWIFSGFCVFACFFVLTYVIETKGRSLEDIQILLSK